MTANVTNRLKLMQPTNTDPFTPDDFRTTFGILDGVPGVKPIPSYGSLPTGLNTYSHGSLYLQTDLMILWSWNQPNSTTTGAWKRVNGQGGLGSDSLSSSVSTTAVDDAHAIELLKVVCKSPGSGRWTFATCFLGSVSNTGSYGVAVAGLEYNGSVGTRAYANGDPTSGQFVSMTYVLGNPPQGTTMTFRVTLKGFQSGTTRYNAGGGARLWVYEI